MATADVIAPLAADFGALTFELQDVHDDQLDTAIWLEANPEFALALLDDEEVESLANIAQKNAEFAGHTVRFDKTFDIIKYLGFTVSIRVVGAVDLDNQTISLQTYISLSSPIKKYQIKGPKLEGSIKDGIHFGPVSIPLPHVGTLDIWAKVVGKYLEITVKLVFFGRYYWKKISIPIS